jgi:carbon storage regulator
MLVLSRQRDETIMIGDDIEITIVDIRGDKVRLGITAPATIPVHRKEVYEAIQRENREAAKVKMEDLPNLPTPPHMPRPQKGPGAPGQGTTPPHQRPQVPFTRPPNTGGTPQPPASGRPTPPQTPPAPPNPGQPNGPDQKGPVGSR